MMQRAAPRTLDSTPVLCDNGTLPALAKCRRILMTTATDTLIPSSSDVAPLRAKSGWIIALGVAFVVAGLIALGSVVMATVASVFVVGIMMMIAGVFEVINAFQFKSWGRFLLWVLLGVLYIVAGFVTFGKPAARGGGAHLLGARCRAGGFGCDAHRAGGRHAQGETMGMGVDRAVGRHHALAGAC